MLSGLRLSEAALHGWDIKVASDPQATLTGQEADASLEQLTGPLSFMVGFRGKPQALGGTEVTLRVEMTTPQRILGLVLGRTVSIGEAPADADGVLTGPAEAWLRLLAGRLDATHTPGTLTLTSDAVTLDQLRTVFPGY